MNTRFRFDPAEVIGRSPRVALVHDWLTGMRGGEKCLEALCRLFPRATIHTLIHDQGTLSPTIEAMTIRTSPLQRLPGVAKHYRKLLPLMPWAAKYWDVGDVDLVISLSHCVAKSVRTPPNVPHVCYCFTPMRYAWDGRDAYLDVWRRKPLRRAVASRLLDRFQAWDRESARNVTEFIAISQTVQNRIERHYGRPSAIIHPPVDVTFFTPNAQQRRDFYLCVSALVPYKKIDQAIMACNQLKRPLIVIGKGSEEERLRQIAGPTIQLLGWQPNEVIREYYQHCRALLFPGEEDFGIVPIEALACGAPVIAFNRGGVPETVDNRLGGVYDEGTADGLAEAIRKFEDQANLFDSALARRTAERFATEIYERRMLEFAACVLSKKDGEPVISARNPASRGLGLKTSNRIEVVESSLAQPNRMDLSKD